MEYVVWIGLIGYLVMAFLTFCYVLDLRAPNRATEWIASVVVGLSWPCYFLFRILNRLAG